MGGAWHGVQAGRQAGDGCCRTGKGKHSSRKGGRRPHARVVSAKTRGGVACGGGGGTRTRFGRRRRRRGPGRGRVFQQGHCVAFGAHAREGARRVPATPAGRAGMQWRAVALALEPRHLIGHGSGCGGPRVAAGACRTLGPPPAGLGLPDSVRSFCGARFARWSLGRLSYRYTQYHFRSGCRTGGRGVWRNKDPGAAVVGAYGVDQHVQTGYGGAYRSWRGRLPGAWLLLSSMYVPGWGIA